MKTRRTGSATNMPGRLATELHRRGFGLAAVAARARCSYRFVQYVLKGEHARGKKAQRVLRVVRRMLARKPTVLLTLRDLTRRRAA